MHAVGTHCRGRPVILAKSAWRNEGNARPCSRVVDKGILSRWVRVRANPAGRSDDSS